MGDFYVNVQYSGFPLCFWQNIVYTKNIDTVGCNNFSVMTILQIKFYILKFYFLKVVKRKHCFMKVKDTPLVT